MRVWGMRFDREAAAHLYRRVAFAATPADLDRVAKQRPGDTIDELLAAKAPAVSELEEAMRSQDDRAQLAGAVLHRLATSTAPLRENVALFLHNHFVSALSKVREGRMMLDQLDLFRTMGLGKFEDLTKAVTRDPAMVRYLDLERSNRSQPNENFARELMELFTTGPGPYTEQDIKEAARAFTGHHLRSGRFVFSEAAHDPGPKTVLGTQGDLDGDDVVAILADHPTTARFMGAKIARHFLTDDPSQEDLDLVARLWAGQKGHLGATLAMLCRTERFMFDLARFTVTRSPAALITATAKLLGYSLPPVEAAHHAFAMGQALLDPPTVKGYPGGRRWLNPATLLARRTFLLESVRGARKAKALPAALAQADPNVPEAFEHLFGRRPHPNDMRIIESALAAGSDRGAGALEVLICHPLFQMC